jgi:alkylhydroperoxidase/carboxymuconolactone decarboxylase family protein YurZ
MFWQGSNFGQGGGGYNGRGTFTAGAWHRVVAAYDMAANPPVVVKYVDGIKQDDWTANQSLDNPRRALAATAILFGDGDQDERRIMYVNAVQIRSARLSDAEIVALGGPSAAGIPVIIPKSTVKGHWDFDYADLKANIGQPLAYLDGDAGLTKAGTTFGTTGEGDFAEIPNINGTAAKVMKVPGDLDRNIGYVMTHGIAPNGGGTRVNQYTLIMDVYVDTAGPGAASLWQTSSANNTDDGDLFWQGSNFGQGGGGYNGTGAFTAGAWHRVAAAYNMAANPPVVTKYVDGIFQDDWTANQSLDNPRRSLAATAILFGDGDQDERRVMYVSSVQIREGALSKPELESLGLPTADGIPVVLSVAPPVVVGPTVTTTVPAGLSGTPLTGAVINTATKTITADIPADGTQGYLTITPAVVITSSKIEGGKLVITYQ